MDSNAERQGDDALPSQLDVHIFGNCQSIVDLNTKVSDGTFNFRMPEQQLYGPQITSPSINQRRFCTSN